MATKIASAGSTGGIEQAMLQEHLSAGLEVVVWTTEIKTTIDSEKSGCEELAMPEPQGHIEFFV